MLSYKIIRYVAKTGEDRIAEGEKPKI